MPRLYSGIGSAPTVAPGAAHQSHTCPCPRCRQRRLQLETLIDADLGVGERDLETELPVLIKREISARVGAGGTNRQEDVRAVQLLLNTFILANRLPGLRALKIDGLIGPSTINAIKEFQRIFVGMRSPDGRVDPRGRTLEKLNGSVLQQPASIAGGTPVAGDGAAAACRVQGATARCGNCMATERRLRSAPKPTLGIVTKELRRNPARKIRLDAAAATAYADMVRAARTAGIAAPFLQIASGHRDYDHQARLWRTRLLNRFRQSGCSTTARACVERAINRTSTALRAQPMPHGRNAWLDRFLAELRQTNCATGCDPTAQVRALRVGTAPPGRSPHHTGRAIDVHVGGGISTAAGNVAFQRRQAPYRWLVCNAARFGFRPYNREPWHWEYNP